MIDLDDSANSTAIAAGLFSPGQYTGLHSNRRPAIGGPSKSKPVTQFATPSTQNTRWQRLPTGVLKWSGRESNPRPSHCERERRPTQVVISKGLRQAILPLAVLLAVAKR